MAMNLANKDKTEFWRDIAKNHNSKTPLPDHIDEAKGTKEILSLWKKHFYDIFNCIKNEGKTRTANNIVEDVNKIIVDHQIVKEAIKKLSLNNSWNDPACYSVINDSCKEAHHRKATIHLLSCFPVISFFIHYTKPGMI